jgi:hypothetical protein
MAVELTKVALWIETVDPGKPLGFFDAQIRCGDALLGVFDLKALDHGIPDAAYKPLAGDDRDLARLYQRLNRSQREGQGTLDFSGRSTLPELPALAADYKGFRDLAEDTLADVQAKADRYRQWQVSPRYLRDSAACDLYIAAFLAPKTGTPPTTRGSRTIPTSEEVWSAKRGAPGTVLHEDKRSAAARDARAFHWPLQFPDVFAEGGFDVVLGNPPWEVMQLSEKEYFAATQPHIANLAGAARKRAIDDLAQSNLEAYTDYLTKLRAFEAANEFARESGRFPLTARGKVNTYALFAELFANLTNKKGRSGVIVPTGIATDATTAPFFADLVAKQRLSQLVDFENSAPIFPGVHRSFKFSLLTLGRNEPLARFAFFLTEPAQLAEPERNFTLSPAQIARLNPNTRTAPVFRSRKDADLTARIYDAAPVLIEEAKGDEGNPWGVEFRQGLFNMTSDSALFRTAAQLSAEGFQRDGVNWHRPFDPAAVPAPTVIPAQAGIHAPLDPRLRGDDRQRAAETFVPLYEAKMIHQFDHRWAGYAENGTDSADFDAKHDPTREPAPRYWVPKGEVDTRLADKGWTRSWLMGWRDIARATDERTTIFSIVPRCAVGHTMPLIFPEASPAQWADLLANLNALTLDYAARQAVGGTHLTYGYLKQFPVLPPSFYTPERLAFLTPRVLELTYTSHALAPFARDLGHDGPPFPWDEGRRATLRADLDAFFARAYRLTRDDLRYILDPADVMGPDYPSETFRVLKEKELRLHNEYRTRRLVLEAWDRMEADGTFTALDL